MDDLDRLTTNDLVLIRKSLHAYMEHLNPSAIHIREVAEWREKVSLLEHKISRIILSNKV